MPKLSAEAIAEAVGNWHGNNFMKPHLKVYIDALRRAGFEIYQTSNGEIHDPTIPLSRL